MITVLLPTYNNSLHITSAVRSILGQTFKDFELLIIDDCSTDDTVGKIKSFNDPRIRLIINNENKELGKTLNIGLEKAKYELVARMDGDDISLPERLQKQYEYMTANGGTDVLSCSYAVFSSDKILYTIKTSENHNDIKKRLALHSEIIHPGVMYRKSRILENGGYGDSYIEDYELWLRVKDKLKFHNLRETLLLKRYHGKSISLDIERKNKNVYEYTEKYYHNPVAEFGIDKKEENIIRGWREYFYGSRSKTRKYFLKSPFRLFLSPRIFIGLFVTFLNNNLFLKFKEMRFRFRAGYWFKYISKENRMLRKHLKKSEGRYKVILR